MNTNIIIAGFGGQGVVVASKLISEYYFEIGEEVKTSTLIGLGVRGGGIYCHVKAGKGIKSPIIKSGDADILIGLEELELVRWIDYLKPGGHVFINNIRITPTTVSSGIQDEMNIDIDSIIDNKTTKVITFDGYKYCKNLGSSIVLNLIPLGMLSAYFDHDYEAWIKVLKKNVPKKHYELNKNAFTYGRDFILKSKSKVIGDMVRI